MDAGECGRGGLVAEGERFFVFDHTPTTNLLVTDAENQNAHHGRSRRRAGRVHGQGRVGLRRAGGHPSGEGGAGEGGDGEGLFPLLPSFSPPLSPTPQAEVFEEIPTMEHAFHGIPTVPPRKDMSHMVREAEKGGGGGGKESFERCRKTKRQLLFHTHRPSSAGGVATASPRFPTGRRPG